ncbi:hypothetical protein KSX_19640 [Ktedonospora formicarum]|uniref:Uncharacterized protein n=1 Tax=Ktedonospora formicarum TaxID=2778364 RepID=A0A8J3HXH5_9CHLR|nr:hypothetical protein KSX_19640 [Ktedonospora formicarum]
MTFVNTLKIVILLVIRKLSDIVWLERNFISRILRLRIGSYKACLRKFGFCFAYEESSDFAGARTIQKEFYMVLLHKVRNNKSG